MAAIKREDLEAGRVDLSDVIDPAALPLPPVSPGEVLRAEFLEPLQLSASALARAIAVPRNRLTGIINGKRAVTADTALRLEHLFRHLGRVLAVAAGELRPQARPPRDRRAPPPRDHPPRGLIQARGQARGLSGGHVHRADVGSAFSPSRS